MSREVQCVECYQPDMPFCEYYIFTGYNKAHYIYDSPTETQHKIITEEQANKQIEKFDLLINGGNPDEA